MRKKVLGIVAATVCIVAASLGLAGVQPASAQGTIMIGWVLDQHGSVACYRNSNHVWCNAYPQGNPNIYATVIDDWLGVGPAGCPLNGIYLYGGSTGGAPAQLYYNQYCKLNSAGGYIGSGILIPCVPLQSCWGYGSVSRPGSPQYGYVYTQPNGNGTLSLIYGV